MESESAGGKEAGAVGWRPLKPMDAGKQVFGIVVAVVGLVVLFAPLAAVLIAAAAKGRGRVLAWAFGGSLLAAVAWLGAVLVVRQWWSQEVAMWSLLGAPWASALGAAAGWRIKRGAANGDAPSKA